MAQTSASRLIEEKEYQHKIAKLWVWIVWLGTMLVSAAYCVVSILSFEHVLSVYNSDDDGVDDHELWAFLGATIIAPAMVIGFYFFGTFVLIKKTVTEGGMSYSYGALHVSTLWMSMLVLLASVSIHAYKDRMKRWESTNFTEDTERVQDWDGGKTTQAQVAYVLGYLLSLVFLVLFFFLFLFRSAAKRLIIDPKLKKREEDEHRQAEEQALLRAQLEQQQAEAKKTGTIAAAPAVVKKPEAAGSEVKPDAAVKVEEPPKKVVKPVEAVAAVPPAGAPVAAAPVAAAPAAKPAEPVAVRLDDAPEEKKKAAPGSWWSRKPKAGEAEGKDSAAVRTPAVGPEHVSGDAQPKI